LRAHPVTSACRASDPPPTALAVGEKYIAWDQIHLFKEKENGTWTVDMFMDDRLLVSKEFVIQKLPALSPGQESSSEFPL
jgi:hypothetical protein